MKQILLACVLAVSLNAHAGDDTLYRDLGGQEGISKFVKDFIPMIKSDPRIAEFFKDTDTVKLASLLTEQFCQLAGGPCKYSGRDMVAVHDGMGVKLAHFNALAEDLQVAMENNGVSNSAANRLVAKLAPMHRAVVR